MSASAGILRTQLHFFFDDHVEAGLRPAWTGQSPVLTQESSRLWGTRPGQFVTSISKLDHSADRLDCRIMNP
jgi:hypothetical protein